VSVATQVAHRLLTLAAIEWAAGRPDNAEQVIAFTTRGLNGEPLDDCDCPECDEATE
jgi:hypothetical protein